MYTERFSEGAALLASIHPASYNSEQNTGYVSLANYARAVVRIHCGALAGNLDVDLEEGTNTSGGSAQSFDAGGKDITITGTTDNNTVEIIEIKGEEFTDGFNCINVEVTPGAAGIFDVEIWGLEPRYKPVATTALHSVTD